MPSRFVALVGTVALLQGTACSLIFIQKPPPGPVEPAPPVECTSSNEYPVIDSVVGWPVLLGGAYAVGYGGAPMFLANGAPLPIFWGGLAAMVAGSIIAGSGLGGFQRTSECRGLKESQLECVSGVEAACVLLKARTP